MLAGLIEKSMNLGPEWTVAGVEFREGLPTGDELHIFIVRTPGSSVECPSCHRRCGVYDARPGEWRHLDIWQYKTIIHCDVPRADCPECGVRTSSVPWASEDAARFTALFEAHALVMVMSGMPVSGAAKVLRLNDTVPWRMLNKLAKRARAGQLRGRHARRRRRDGQEEGPQLPHGLRRPRRSARHVLLRGARRHRNGRLSPPTSEPTAATPMR